MKINFKSIYFFVLLQALLIYTQISYAAGSDLNPLNAETIDELVAIILDAAIKIGVPVVTFMILWAGFLYATAAGKPADIDKAHKAITYAIIGTAIVVGAKIIHSILVNTLLQLSA